MPYGGIMAMRIFLCLLFLLIPFSKSFGSGEIEQRVKTLEDFSKMQQKTIEQQQGVIDELKKGQKPEEDSGKQKTTAGSGLFGGSALSNPNISLIVNSFFYSSNISGADLPNRGIPGFTTAGIGRQKGFNLDSAELFIFAPVDPYFNLYTNIPVTEDSAEVEEAYFITSSLPEGLQLKGGKFKSGFGRVNSQHPHAWDFADLPIVYRAFIGGEGIAEKGIQLTYLPILPFYTQLGVEALQGENESLFGSDAKSGPHAYGVFAKTSFDFGDDSTILFGPSVLTGKTKTDLVARDTEFTGTSTLYDIEFTYKWKPSKVRSFIIQGEYMLRDQKGDLTNTSLSTRNPFKRSQDGVYVQGIYQLNRWRIGARYELLEIFKDQYLLSGTEQSFGRKPWRATGDIEFNLTEFSRIRFQYNYDRSAGDGRTNNEVFMQLIFGIGAHAAHRF